MVKVSMAVSDRLGSKRTNVQKLDFVSPLETFLKCAALCILLA